MPDIFVAKDAKKERKRPTVSIQDSESRQKDPAVKKPKKATVTHPKTHKEKEKLPGHTHNPLASFSSFPDKVDFETRHKEEKIVLLLRRHPITNTGWILTVVLMILAPILLIIFPILSFLPASFQLIAILGWYLITIAVALEGFLTWFFNVNIITDERIIDIDFHDLIYKEVSDAKADKIQDVTYKMGGVIRTIFNYGDVYIQTAAEVPTFQFLAVPKPDRVARVLQDLIIEEEKEKLEGRVR